jgi:molecular chaperone Hsp33
MTTQDTISPAKQAFLNKDRMLRGITEDGLLRIAVVKTTDVVKEAKKRHGLSLLNTVMLGRALTGAILLASNLKGEERFGLRFEGNGPIGSISAEANYAGEIRGYVRSPLAELDYNAGQTLEDGLGIGLLHATKVLFNEAEPVTSTVELTHSNINGDLAHFLLRSEQIPSAILLDVEINAQGEVEHAGGALVQAMPGASEQDLIAVEQTMNSMESIGSLLQQGLYIDGIMERIFGDIPHKELTRRPVHFFCRCTRDRFKNLLMTLGIQGLQELQDETQELICHYCSERYNITADEIKELISQLQ